RNSVTQSVLRLSSLQRSLSHILLRGLSIIRRANQPSHNRTSRHDTNSPRATKEINRALTSLLQARKCSRANTLNRASHTSNSSRRTTPNRRKYATSPVPAIASIKSRLLSHTAKLALILRILFQRQ